MAKTTCHSRRSARQPSSAGPRPGQIEEKSDSRARIVIVILAGGLSSRMGRDKSRLKWKGQTLLGHMRSLAMETQLPVRVIRRDRVPRCGPLGGIYTAFLRWRAHGFLFLPCDMPALTPKLLNAIIKSSDARMEAIFTETDHGPGFPVFLPRGCQQQLETQINQEEFSLQRLASALSAKSFPLRGNQRQQGTNVNTPEEWRRFLNKLKSKRRLQASPSRPRKSRRSTRSKTVKVSL